MKVNLSVVTLAQDKNTALSRTEIGSKSRNGLFGKTTRERERKPRARDAQNDLDFTKAGSDYDNSRGLGSKKSFRA